MKILTTLRHKNTNLIFNIHYLKSMNVALMS